MTENKKVEILYKKSNLFRTVYCNEIFGGVSPDGRIEINFFRTTNDFPDKVVHRLDEDDRIREEIIELREPQNPELVRSVETSILMDLHGAEGLKNWLETKIEELKKIQGMGN